jgi:hypothetical protein
MSPTVEKVLAELTAAEQRELQGLLGQKQTFFPRPTAQLANEIKGKYSFVATSSEAPVARKQEEIDLEGKHNGKRRW